MGYSLIRYINPKRIRADQFKITDLEQLKVIQVTGTNGKGSTYTFVDSILREYRDATGFPAKVRLYTSPHILNVLERIKINSKPISEEYFTKYFFETQDRIAPGGVLDGTSF